MNASLGDLSLSLALLLAAATMLAATVAVRFKTSRAVTAGQWLIGGMLGCFTCALILLTVASVMSDFRLEYVANYTERALPAGYKFAAVWAGQEGSLLLWGWLLSLLCFIATWTFRRLGEPEQAFTFMGMALIVGFFAALLVFAANPFKVFANGGPIDGRGLNPMLQDPGMIIHPPLLFTGYAAFGVPFAVLIGVLAAGRTDNRWLADIRRWVLFAWLFLTAGIVVGAWWAYVELGWGGYWAWDPVENASLLPWLTGTALLHAMMVQQRRGMFKRWTAVLIALSFGLCIFGTYLTRSGVIDSVHAFAPSLVGSFFLVFLATVVIAPVALIIWRRRTLAAEHELEGLVSREGAFFMSIVLLVVMMATTLIGTIWPILSSAVGSEAVTVKPAFYNRVVAPMGLGLVAIMAIAPVLTSGRSAAEQIASSLKRPAVASVIITALAAVLVTLNPIALLCIFITALGTVTVVVSFADALRARRQSTGETALGATVRMIDRDHRRYGGQVAHLGIMLLVIGVAASSLFSLEQTFSLKPGETASLGDVDLTYMALGDERHANFTAIEATVEIRRGGELIDVLHPQVRYYDAWGNEPNSEVAIRSGWDRDIYVSLAGWENRGAVAAIQLRVNPGVLWIWVGGIVMAAGGLFCMTPPILPRTRAAAEPLQVRDDGSRHPLPARQAQPTLVSGRVRTEPVQ